MTLKRKMLALYAALAVVILAVVGGLLSARFRHDRLEDLQRELLNQLKHIDFALTSFMAEAESDVATLAANELVRTRQDQDFTSYLEADPETLYSVGQVEQGIIDLFNTFRLMHPYVNSVYMGRENGSFVRSHPRAQPTQYDPRTRPWYILARDNPGKVMHTAPYPSVTTSDVNIGVVTALVDDEGLVYGVVGADITLVNLTQYLSGFEVGHKGHILLLDQSGTILTSKDEALRFQPITRLVGDEAETLLGSREGVLPFATAAGASRLFFYTSPHLGWKIAIVVPEDEIGSEIQSAVLPALAGLLLALVLLSGLTFAGLSRAVIRPLMQLHDVTRDIARTGDLDRQVAIKARDEIGSLAASFNQMMLNIRQAQEALRRERDLAEALQNAAATLTTTLDFEVVLDRILEQVSRVIPNEACNFMLIEEDRVRAVRWLGYERFGTEEYIAQAEFSLSLTPTFRQMASSKEPMLVPDVAVHPGWQRFPEIAWLHSYAATPIIGRDQVIGFLSVDSSIPNFFQEHHLEPLRTFAGHAAAAIENARLYEQVKRDAVELEARIAAATEEVRQRAEELAVLNELSRTLTAHLSVEQVLIETYRGASRLLDAANFYITLYDADRDQTTSMLRVVDGQVEQPLPTPHAGLADYLIRSQQPLLLPDRVVERTAELGLEQVAHVEGRTPVSWLGVPIVLGKRVLGTMVVLNYTAPGTYQARDRDLLWALANQAAIAINNAQLYRKSEQHAVELGILYEVGKEITATLALDAMLQTIVDNAVRLVGADKSLLVLLDAQKERLVDIVGHGYDRMQLEAHTFGELQAGLTGWVLCEKVPTLTGDLQNDERQQGAALTSARRSGDRSAAVAPLLIGDQVLGTLTVVNGHSKETFTPADLNLVTMLASQASVAIQKAQLYEAAQEADRLKSAFLASMSHELRTPLNSIIGFTGILLQGLVGPLNDEQQKQLGMVMNSARHLLALINDVLDISKIEAGELELALEPFDVGQAIQRAVQIVTPLADRKGLRLIVEASPEVDRIVGDRRRVEQILINLANNACKFTDAGQVRIRSEIVNSRLVTQVIDTGIGIRPEDVGKLFKPFRQIDTGVARRHEGTGLGLAICDRLVTMMGGKIWVESRWGEGSTFTFTLPLTNPSLRGAERRSNLQ
jgi:signal transduction histidine kinase/HAMP domain-containing protein